MKKRIYKNILGLAVLTIVLISGIFVFFFNVTLHSEAEQQMRIEASYAETAYRDGGVEGNLFKEIAAGEGLRITLVDRNGEVKYDNAVRAETMGNHQDRPEIKEALKEGSGSIIRRSSTMQMETYYLAVMMSDGMILRLARQKNSPIQTFLRLLPVLGAVAALILLCAYLIAYKLAGGIARRVNEIDLHHPSRESDFPELWPLLHRIEKQNTQLKEQMTNLLEQEQKFNTITNNMNEGLILLDMDSRILFINRSCKELFNVPTMHYEGKHISLFNRSEQLNETVAMALKGETYSAMLKLPEKQVQFFGNPVLENGQVKGAVLIVLDVTSNQKAEQLRKEFSANVSHELKTPLTSISGYAELIRNGMVKSDDIPAFAGKIYDEAARLITLVNDIIKISQLDERDSRQNKETVDLYAVAGEVKTRLLPVAEKNDVEVKLEGQPVKVVASRQMMYDLIYNLCENGIKYNVAGGFVTTSIYEDEDGHPIIRVSDTGIGIPMEYQERIFERFYRIDKSHSKQTGGTGLGLSIVRHVVEYQGGYIEIHSNQEEGTTITIHLES